MADDNVSEPLYFWRESDAETGWLSQWYYCPFRDDKDTNKIYYTAEHYMMHHKALLFNDKDIAQQILKAGHPRNVKNLGRKVKGFNESTWNAERESIVRHGNMLKFTTAVSEKGFRKGTSASVELPLLDGSLRDMLLRTGDQEIVEASPFDTIWGIGFNSVHAGDNRDSWGDNLLGKALMEVRLALRSQKASE